MALFQEKENPYFLDILLSPYNNYQSLYYKSQKNLDFIIYFVH